MASVGLQSAVCIYAHSLSLSLSCSFFSHSIKLSKVEVVVFPFCFLNNEKKIALRQLLVFSHKSLAVIETLFNFDFSRFILFFASARFYLSPVHRETYARQWLQQQHICINRHFLFAKNSNNARESERASESETS